MYLSMECETCGEELFYGLVATTETRAGHPVYPFDVTSQIRIDCDNCGGITYTGDFDEMVEHEEGEVPVDDEDDAEDDATEDAAT